MAALMATQAIAMAQVPEPRCDGFPPQDHRFDTKADVIGTTSGPCFGQLYPVVSDNSRFARAATIQSLVVISPTRQGRFQMIGLREFRYQPNRNIRGWDRAALRLTYTLPNGERVSQQLDLRLTSDDEYNRMRADGTLN
jgi:hypothetical protein